MAAEVLDGETVRRWCRLGADALGQARAAIDALNVFPVPDADTGTNMHITLAAAAEAAEALPAGAGSADIWQAAASGALLGACGNSGIILSQLLRGMADVCMAESPCDGPVMARALTHAAASARAAVTHPAEGTMLTVADAAARAGTGATGISAGEGALAAVITAAALAAREALARTREQLDVLAARGVVDAGAAGLCVLLDALAAAITGAGPSAFEVPAGSAAALLPVSAASADPGAPAAFGYEVTYLLDAPRDAVTGLRARLDALGDSLVIVGGEDLWHVHVHVADAGAAIEQGLRAGRLHRITVTWLAATALGGPVAPGSEHAVVAVADSDGLASLLRRAGARVLPRPGPDGLPLPALMNTIRQAGRHVTFLHNGPQGISLVRSAAAWLAREGIDVSVIPVHSPLQGLAALAVHDPRRGFEADVAAMSRAAAGMRCGSVIAADGGAVGLDGDEVRVTAATQGEVAAALAAGLLSEGGELVTLMEGADAEPGLARLVADGVGRACPGAEVVCYKGGPVPLLIGVE
jgi:DAK2 domain fusion protein YloV